LRRWAANEVATELRRMRKRRRVLQAALAAKAGTGQSAISRIEKEDYDGWTFKTLFSIALALDARLRIELEPIEDVVRSLRRQEQQTIEQPISATSASSAAMLGEGQTVVGPPEKSDGTASLINIVAAHAAAHLS
jgi:transcriptional regulator with XRE-family HTH domain